MRLEQTNFLNRMEGKRNRLVMLIQNQIVKAFIHPASIRNSKNKINSLATLIAFVSRVEFSRIGVELCPLLSNTHIDLNSQTISHILKISYQRLPQFF